jgi:hypothetical protein
MSKAYLATGEYSQLICAYDKDPAKALKKTAKLLSAVMKYEEDTMLTGVNVAYDDEGFYSITATISTTTITL